MRKRSFQNQNLFYRYYRKFCNLQKRISLLMRSGEFFDLSREIRHRLIRRLQLLYKRVQRLAGKQALKWAGAAIGLILSASVANAQFNDPVRVSGFNTRDLPAPAFVDFDEDGDMDIIIGEYYGAVYYVQNDEGVYSVTASNPFSSIDVLYYAAPAPVDLDDDGDLDLVVGNWYGTFAYFENNAGTFVEQTGLDNPFDGIDIGSGSHPVFINIDGDGDFDMVSGDYWGIINYFENDGGIFTQQLGLDNPFDVVSIVGVYLTAPAFADFDDDSDLDLVIGEYFGTILYYRNISDVFTEQTGANNPWDGLDVGFSANPAVWDVDNEGDLDLVIGDHYSQVLRFFRNDAGTYNEKRGEPNPFEGLMGLLVADPAFGDVDDDGDLDLVIGDGYGDLRFYENTNEGLELRITEEDNPFYGSDFIVDAVAKPVFNDVDGDGDMDLVVGEYLDTLHYYNNDNGDFFEVEDNPFNEVIVPFFSSPSFADVDDDGDDDLIVGSYYGTSGRISYFRNVSGEFFEQTGVNNPFDFINSAAMESMLCPTFADIDRDGDMDLYLGDKYSGSIRLYENDGGAFTEMTGGNNPFDGLVFDGGPVPTFADVDDDGDLDLYVGAFTKYNGGEIYFLESTQGPIIDITDPQLSGDLITIYSLDHTIVIDGGSNILGQVDVYSVSGELLTTQTIDRSGRYELYLPDAAAGIYIVRAYSDGVPTVNKVTIR